MKMDPEVKTKWVAALRSGQYRQGRGHLNKSGEMCCLGVLCAIAVEDGIIPPPVVDEHDFTRTAMSYDGMVYFPPQAVAQWAGFERKTDGEDAWYDDCPRPGGMSVVDMNDDEEATFAEIADAIEEYL